MIANSNRPLRHAASMVVPPWAFLLLGLVLLSGCQSPTEPGAENGREQGTAPRITSPPGSHTTTQGSAVTVFVLASGTTPFTYQWFSNGVALADGANVSGANGPSMTMRNLQPVNAGPIRVTVSNAFGSDTATATLTVR